MTQTPDSIKVPKTITPWGSFFFWNGILLFVSWMIWSTLLFPFTGRGMQWAALLTLLELGVLIASGVIAKDIPDWYGTLAFNPITKKRRAIFPGLTWMVFFERLEKPLEHLKREISSGGPLEHLPTNDPTETMEAVLLIHMRIDISGTAEEAAENMKRFKGVEEETLKSLVDGDVLKMFSAHYAQNEMEKLTDARAVQEAVMGDEKNKTKIQELGRKYGVHIGVTLKSSNPDARTKKLKETGARAEALRLAMEKLMEDVKDPASGKVLKKGLGPDEARRAALAMDETAEFSEHHVNVQLDATGLDNLRDVHLFPPGFVSGKSKQGGNKQ